MKNVFGKLFRGKSLLVTLVLVQKFTLARWAQAVMGGGGALPRNASPWRRALLQKYIHNLGILVALSNFKRISIEYFNRLVYSYSVAISNALRYILHTQKTYGRLEMPGNFNKFLKNFQLSNKRLTNAIVKKVYTFSKSVFI